MVERTLSLAIGLYTGLLAARTFVQRKLTLLQAVRQPTVQSLVLLIEAITCPIAAITFSIGHGLMFATDWYSAKFQLLLAAPQLSWSLFTTGLMSLHWRDVRKELMTNDPIRANVLTANRRRIWIMLGVTVVRKRERDRARVPLS